MPAWLVDEAALNKAVVKSVTAQGENKQIELRIKGRTELLRRE